MDDFFDDLYVDLKEKYPCFRGYETKDSTEPNLSLIQKSDSLGVIDQQSTVSQQARLAEPSQKIEELSQEQEEDTDQQINVIVEEDSNDFTNRKANEELSPEHKDGQGEYSKFTPSKDVLNSKQIVSDLKSECDFEDQDKQNKAEQIGKKHEINSLMDKLHEEERVEQEDIVLTPQEHPKPAKLESKPSFGYDKAGYSDIEIRDTQLINAPSKNPFNHADPSPSEKYGDQKEEEKVSPHFEKSDPEKDKENRIKNTEIHPKTLTYPSLTPTSAQKPVTPQSHPKITTQPSQKPVNPYPASNTPRSTISTKSANLTKYPLSAHLGQGSSKAQKRPQYSRPGSTQKSHSSMSSISKHSYTKPRPSQRMALGNSFKHTYGRVSKIRSKKRDLKEQAKREQPLSDPLKIKETIKQQFRKFKQQPLPNNHNFGIDMQHPNNFKIPSKSSLSNKRKR